ncbi:hypothetical protein BO443_50171 [Burkholderia orbicola]
MSVLERKRRGDAVLLDMDGGVLSLAWAGPAGRRGRAARHAFYDARSGPVTPRLRQGAA